jgi:RHS repeat-associated protein
MKTRLRTLALLFAVALPASRAIAQAPPVRPVDIRPDDGTASRIVGVYTYDPSGNVTGAGVTGGRNDYVYDPMSRVKSATVYHGTLPSTATYAYDLYGNRTDSSLCDSQCSATNHLTNVSYDDAGNVTQWHPAGTSYTRAYAYDATGSMVVEKTVTTPEYAVVHVYTADDERYETIRGSVGGSATFTLRGLGKEVLREYEKTVNGSSTTWSGRDYIYRNGSMLSSFLATTAQTHHYSLDHLGTPRVVSDQDRKIIGEHDYQAFGSEITGQSQIPSEGRLRFTGHERDADIQGEPSGQLDYMHARYYSAALGRFLSVDPGRADAQKPQSWNRYTYTMNNPMRLVDPDGKEPLDPALLQFFRAAFGGRDFTNVNVHSDVPLPGVGLTLGNQIFLDSPNWDARNPTGLGSLAHELDHNIEQGETGVLSFMDQYGSDVASNRRSGMSFGNAYVNASSEQSARVVDNHVVAFLSDPKNRDIATALQKGNALNAKQLARVKSELAPILRQQDANIRVECSDGARSNCRAILEPVPVK